MNEPETSRPDLAFSDLANGATPDNTREGSDSSDKKIDTNIGTKQVKELDGKIDQNSKDSSIGNPFSENADRLIDTRMNLQDVLGDNWKDNCILESIDQALTPEEIKMIEAAQEVSPDLVQTDVEQSITIANQVFAANETNYHAKLLTGEDGRQRILITGKIARDSVYQIVDEQFLSERAENGVMSIAWVPNRLGFVDTEGNVFSIDRLLGSGKYAEKYHTILFIERTGRRYSKNMQVSQGDDHDTITRMPRNWDEVGVFIHELGHLLKNRKLAEEPELRTANKQGNNDFRRISDTKSTFHPEATLSGYQSRTIKTRNERGAWAIGLSILKEVGRKTQLDCTSKQAMRRILKRAENALRTYDTVPYSFLGHDETKAVPAFSDEARKAARELHNLVTKEKTKYSELPSFDQRTGENLANDPKKIIDRLKHDTSSGSK